MRLFWLLAPLAVLAAQDEVVFRSDVALVRVDAQVLDRSNRAITGLNLEDFVLLEDGKTQEIRNFVREEMPVDVLFLIDVSGSMRPHVERLAAASHQALRVLGGDDRVGIMVFDRSTRVRMPLRRNGDSITSEFDALLRQETFDGGTDITRALYDAANFMRTNARGDARRAVVILTDDQTQRDRDERGVGSALLRADTMLSALLTPDAMRHGGIGGGRLPGGGQIGIGLPDIIFGRRGGMGGGGYPGGGGGRFPRGGGGPTVGASTQSAGTAEIARDSGGDSMPVDDASALETTLMRLRQRYSLHYNASSEGASAGTLPVEVRLSDDARRRYAGAEVRYRRIHQSGSGPADPVQISRGGPAPPAPASTGGVQDDSERPNLRRRPVSEPSSGRGPNPALGGGWPKASTEGAEAAGSANGNPAPAAPPQETVAPAAEGQPAKPGGWRKLKPGEQP